MTNMKFLCSHCSKEFRYDSERKRHEQSHVPQFQCKVCCKQFSFISALRRHEKQHERTGRVQCKECGRQFMDSSLLTRHIKYAHAGTFTCTKCDGTFSSDIALHAHMKTHKASTEKKYQCKFEGCNKKFNFSHHLKHHELTHTNSKQYYCKICGKGFIQAHNFKNHLKTHTEDPSLICDFPGCDKKFATEYSKKRHQVVNHPAKEKEELSGPNSTPFAPVIHEIESNAVPFSKSDQQIINSETDSLSEKLKSNEDGVKLTKDTNTIHENQTQYNCELAIGCCIMKERDEICVCAQIPDVNNDDCGFEPIKKETIKMNKLDINAKDCESCDCLGLCNNNSSGAYDVPIIEYKSNGTVKVKMTCDIDFSTDTTEKDKKDAKMSVLFNSCKAVLGNCIVSGDGSIDEGCLCARMAMGDQVTAQEIEDITPCPKELQSFSEL